ncbi:MAG: acetyl-CoA carboxylase biotin carboxyl carrier protein, partial [Methylobacterium sp.]
MPKNDAIDPELVRELANLVTETGLSEIEVEKGDLRIRVARRLEPVNVQVAAPAPLAAVAPSPLAPAEPARAQPGTVPSPMVGTAYLRPSP